MTIDWLSDAAFRAAFDEQYRPRRIALDQEITADLGADAIRNRVGAAGISNPDDAGDEPGAVLRWYGRAGDTLFFLTAYESKDLSVLTTRRAPHGYAWSTLSDLDELSWFLARTTWVSGPPDDAPRHAVCRTDPVGIRRQVYSCASDVEASSLRDFLNRMTLAVAPFFTCQPDSADSHWTIYASDGLTVHGRYTRRESAEETARELSGRTSSEMRVIEQPAERLTARFRNGLKIGES